MTVGLQRDLHPQVLELEGAVAGRISDVSGGPREAAGDTENVVRGRAAGHPPGHVVFRCGAGMSRSFFDWLGSAFAGTALRRTGAVIALDQGGKPLRRLDFQNALVESIALPALDRSGSDAAHLTVALRSERMTLAKGDGASHYAAAVPAAWTTAAFRVQIEGLSADCAHITRVSSISLGQRLKVVYEGASADPTLEPAGIGRSELSLELPGTSAEGFSRWFEDSLTKGNRSVKNGSVDYLGAGGATLFSVALTGLAPSQTSRSAPGGGATTQSVRLELYVQGMGFSAGAAALR